MLVCIQYKQMFFSLNMFIFSLNIYFLSLFFQCVYSFTVYSFVSIHLRARERAFPRRLVRLLSL